MCTALYMGSSGGHLFNFWLLKWDLTTFCRKVLTVSTNITKRILDNPAKERNWKLVIIAKTKLGEILYNVSVKSLIRAKASQMYICKFNMVWRQG